MADDIRELDVVALSKALPGEGLPAGQIGTVVYVHQAGKAYEVEFILEPRRSVVLTLAPDTLLRLVGLDYRRVAV